MYYLYIFYMYWNVCMYRYSFYNWYCCRSILVKWNYWWTNKSDWNGNLMNDNILHYECDMKHSLNQLYIETTQVATQEFIVFVSFQMIKLEGTKIDWRASVQSFKIWIKFLCECVLFQKATIHNCTLNHPC